MTYHKIIQVNTRNREQLCDLTAQMTAAVPAGFNGVCMAFSLHTTAGITINENADPDVGRDILAQLNLMIPRNARHYQHAEGNSDAHIKASLLGLHASVPVEHGKLLLGTWQSVYFAEFDGPRRRRVAVQLLPAAEVES